MQMLCTLKFKHGNVTTVCVSTHIHTHTQPSATRTKCVNKEMMNKLWCIYMLEQKYSNTERYVTMKRWDNPGRLGEMNTWRTYIEHLSAKKLFISQEITWFAKVRSIQPLARYDTSAAVPYSAKASQTGPQIQFTYNTLTVKWLL